MEIGIVWLPVCSYRAYGTEQSLNANHTQPYKSTIKPVLSGHSKRTQKMIFNTDYRIMQVKSIAECSRILLY